MSFNWGIFSAKQLEVIANSTARLNILDGSVRSGKTIASLVAWIMFVAEAPRGGELLMAGKTERTLKRNVLDVLEQMVGSQYFTFNLGAGEAMLFGRRIYLVGANDLRSEGKIRGLTLAGAYGDEISLWPESFFTMLLSRLSVPGARFIGTTNPDNPYHWLKVNYLDRVKELNLKNWHFTLEDNLNLDPAYVEALKKEYTGLWYKRFILGEWIAAEGIIYDMFDEKIHVVKKLPEKFDKYIIGVDFGMQNPTVFLLAGINNGIAYVVKEYYHEGKEQTKTVDRYSKDFKDWLGDIKPHRIYIDPSAQAFMQQLKVDGFSNVREANNDVLDGIATVSKFLSQQKLFIHHSCKNTIREFYSYVWDTKAQQNGQDKPFKKNDHCMDALRYILHSEYPVGRNFQRKVVDKPRGW